MNQLINQLLKFGIVGVVATGVDWLCFHLLSLIVDFRVANIFAFSFSVVINYILSMRFVFSGSDNKQRDFIVFIVLSLLGFCLNEVVILILYNWLGFIAKVIATGFTMIFNFISRKLVLDKKGVG